MNQNPQQADFVLGTCPDCKKVVRIPVTAVTSQSKTHVCCPMCDSEFEIAEILDEVIPSVKVVDESTATVRTTESDKQPERINAIDTPELFHVSKDDYQPTTEKRNGRFVVPDLLSKGSKSARKKKRSGRRSRRSENDPKLAESLAKLKQNTAATSIPSTETPENSETTDRERNGHRERSGRSSSRSERSRQGRSGSDRQRSGSDRQKSENSRRSRERVRTRQPSSLFSDLMAVRTLTELNRWAGRLLASVKNQVSAKGSKDNPNSKWDLAMIGLGVFLAIPMIHLMLWWFIGVDPFGLARPTSYIAPYVVPNELRIVVEENDDSIPMTVNNSVPLNSNANSSLGMENGKLPTPKIDPSSVHNDKP